MLRLKAAIHAKISIVVFYKNSDSVRHSGWPEEAARYILSSVCRLIQRMHNPAAMLPDNLVLGFSCHFTKGGIALLNPLMGIEEHHRIIYRIEGGSPLVGGVLQLLPGIPRCNFEVFSFNCVFHRMEKTDQMPLVT